MGILNMERWSPYAVGIGIGVLSWIAFFLSNKALGCSTAFARTSGMIEKWIRGPRVSEKPYFRKFAPIIDWEWMLVLGVIVGAFISSLLSGAFHIQWIPSKWAEAFGSSVSVRSLVALVGGVIMGFGARWAGGCTSGHGISGTLQLAVSSWIMVVCLFVGGIVTAMLIFGVFAG